MYNPLNKLSNQYAQGLGELYAKTPKAVIAAIAVSLFINKNCGTEQLNEEFLKEWHALHNAGIVPQKPPKIDKGA